MSSSELDEQRFYQILAKETLFEIKIGLTKKSIRKLQLKIDESRRNKTHQNHSSNSSEISTGSFPISFVFSLMNLKVSHNRC